MKTIKATLAFSIISLFLVILLCATHARFGYFDFRTLADRQEHP